MDQLLDFFEPACKIAFCINSFLCVFLLLKQKKERK